MALHAQIKKSWRWIKALGSLARETWKFLLLILGTGGIGLMFPIVVVAQGSELYIARAGAALQLLGIGMVAIGIRETRKLFGLPGIFDRTRQWFGRWPAYNIATVSGVLAVVQDSDTVNARGIARHKAGPGATIEDRVAALEKNATLIDDRISQAQEEMDANVRRQDEALKQEQRSRAAEDQDIRNTMAVAETGGLDISATGAVWLFSGVICGTIPKDLVDHVAPLLSCLRFLT